MRTSDSNQPSHPFHLVLGNESGDLDSLCSAVARAIFLDQSNDKPDETYLPVFNISRERLQLRRDAQHLLREMEIHPDNLVFVDEIPNPDSKPLDWLRFHLVDHNQLAPSQKAWENLVVSVVDHHSDERCSYPLMSEQSKIVRKVGSAASLISKQFMDQQAVMDSNLATFLLAPIILDTTSLEDEAVTTDDDRLAGKYLTQIATQDTPSRLSKISKLFKDLKSYRHDVTGFTPEMFLHKDLKFFSAFEGSYRYSISSLPKTSPTDWLSSSVYTNALKAFAEKEGVHSAMVFISEGEGDNKFVRLFVYSISEQLSGLVLSHLGSGSERRKHIQEVTFDVGNKIAVFKGHKDLKRKVLQPLFRFEESIDLMNFFKSKV